MSLLCYADGVHLTRNERETLCGRKVYDTPLVPRQVEALTCQECYYLDALDRPPVVPEWPCLCGARNRLRDFTCRNCGAPKP